MPITIKNTQKDKQESFSRFLPYGDFGEGKTYAVGIIDKILKEQGTKGVYIFDFDHGIKTLETAGFSVDYNTYVDFDKKSPRAFAEFNRDFREFEKDNQGYGAVCIDSLTTLQRTMMYEVFRINPTKRQVLTGGGSMASQNDYGVLIEFLMQLFPQLIQVSHHMHVILTAHLRERQNETTSVIEYVPGVIGKSLPSSMGL